jgi:hypothetical protein
MMTRAVLMVMAVFPLILGGCTTEKPAGKGEVQQQASSERSPSGDCPAQHGEDGEKCTCARDTTPPVDTKTTTKADPASGQTVTAVGSRLSGAAQVKVVDLMARPDEFAGKTVRLEGDVPAMCVHRRTWFGIQDPGNKSGAFLRVLTAPAFLVPEGSIGKKARTEGTVEIIEVDAAAARHFARMHGLGDPEAIQGEGKIKSVVLRATGAEFL